MTLNSAIKELEIIRLRAELDGIIGDGLIALQIIHVLLDFANNQQLRDKVEEIVF